MARVQIPAEHDGSLLSYLLTFSSSFTKMQEIKGCLDSVGQNIAQARVLIGQPLGLFACLTAEEEAARFLYLCLRKMKYNLPRYDRLTTHQDKARILLWAMVFEEYFFNFFESISDSYFLSIQKKGRDYSVEMHGRITKEHWVTIPNVLSIVATSGRSENEPAEELSVRRVRETYADVMKKSFGPNHNVAKVIEHIARRRNKCLYGKPKEKLYLADAAELETFETNCSLMVLLGFLIVQDNEKWPSVQLICDELGRLLSHG